MEVEILHTERCVLRPAIKEDANWLFDLLNDPDVVEYIEGIKWFNADVVSVRSFIESMQVNAAKNLGAMWCVEYKSNHIGFILIFDLGMNPFVSFAIAKEYRHKGLGKELVGISYKVLPKIFRIRLPKIESYNPIVVKLKSHFASQLVERQIK